jgi:hypothetical protein
MNKQDLLDQIRALGHMAKDAGFSTAVTVLFTLSGAIQSGQDEDLANLCGAFAVEGRQRILDKFAALN